MPIEQLIKVAITISKIEFIGSSFDCQKIMKGLKKDNPLYKNASVSHANDVITVICEAIPPHKSTNRPQTRSIIKHVEAYLFQQKSNIFGAKISVSRI
jgi:hypothetical protein